MVIGRAVRVGMAAVIATGAVLGVTATPAFAACGSKCDGKNPATYSYLDGGGAGVPVVCQNDAIRPADTSTKKYLVRTNPNLGANSAYIELRYSPICRTAWARTNAVGWTINVHSYHANGSYRIGAEQHTNASTKWTAMVNDAGLTAKACISVPVSDSNICTALY